MSGRKAAIFMANKIFELVIITLAHSAEREVKSKEVPINLRSTAGQRFVDLVICLRMPWRVFVCR